MASEHGPTNDAPNPPPIPLDYAAPEQGKGSAAWWIAAFICYPYGVLIYLAVLQAMRWPLAIFLMITTAAVCTSLVTVLAKTNGDPWQQWLVLVMSISLYCLGMLCYFTGDRHQVWSWQGKRLWRGAAWILGILLVANILGAVVEFHLKNR